MSIFDSPPTIFFCQIVNKVKVKVKSFQLRSLKQDDMSLEDFITKAKGLIDESGYHQDFREL